MKKTLISILSIGVFRLVTAQTYSPYYCSSHVAAGTDAMWIGCNTDPWVPVFFDDFNNETLDDSYWKKVTGVNRDFEFIAAKQWYEADNVSLSSGNLYLTAKYEPGNRTYFDEALQQTVTNYFDFTAAEIWSRWPLGFGKLEAMCKIPPSDNGFLPAFWMYGGVQRYNELDVFEFVPWDTHEHIMTSHFSDAMGTKHACGKTVDYGFDFASDFHKFTVIYDYYGIEWRVDDVLIGRKSSRYHDLFGIALDCEWMDDWLGFGYNYGHDLSMPEEPMHIILNLALHAGGPPSVSTLPKSLEVQWVKFSRQQQCDVRHIISSVDQLPQEDAFHFIAGNSIEMSGLDITPVSYSIQLYLKASDYILLSPDVLVDVPFFYAQIDENLCADEESNDDTKSLITYNNENIESVIKPLPVDREPVLSPRKETLLSDLLNVEIVQRPDIITVYPISSTRISQYYLYAIDGKLIESGSNLNTLVFYQYAYATGIYSLILIDDKNNQRVEKIIITNN